MGTTCPQSFIYKWCKHKHYCIALQWRHHEHDGVSNRQPHDCLLNRLFRRRSMKTSKLRVTSLCAGNSPVTGEFPAERANNADNVSFDNVIMSSPPFYTIWSLYHMAREHGSSVKTNCKWAISFSLWNVVGWSFRLLGNFHDLCSVWASEGETHI